ncbi:helix-turn-helix and ligand-binding sensor domain-containing protein [Jejuia spongiicola]|uniref:LuxR C-terminal-related transcriptional regulator n=1 Tax=Jejuia spongiicola TaxID=2942207 RepID=A0ABT0QIV5_9FLAO|nr:MULTISPECIES: triple tyrosine motif-containing protein [Flavobacteriaceae]MCL6296408.1 LuxR C-terminal-related transcriptional regulator [Jejuia spongiicola]PIA82347.1 LuxR family transcriptional regulator [Gaetbulibacter sp. 4G1]
MSLCVKAQEIPPIEIYTPKMYGAANQNWCIAQSKNNHIYVANNEGLLEFNGADWHLYSSPNETIIRSVSVINDLIYTGCSKEFGYWQRNEFGQLYYTSLSKKLNIDFLEGEEFWNIVALDDYILFQSLKRIYIYDKSNESYSFIDSDTTIYKVFKVNESIYFQKTKDGLYKIENGAPKLISESPLIKNSLMVNIFNHKGNLLIETENNGFYILNDNSIKKWDILANKIPQSGVYRSTQLRDGSFVLGTRSNGVMQLTPEGEISNHIDIINGLSNNTIHYIFEDAESNIWLALDNGINCINIKSPFRIYNDKEGRIGTVYASTVHDGYLYLGSNQGLYCRPIDSSEEFKFIEGTQGPVWCLVKVDDTLFCGHDAGTFSINRDKADLIVDIQGTWNIIPIDEDRNTLLQGNYDGLNVIEKINNKWQFKNNIEGFNISSKFFEIYNKNQIFVSHESKGVYKINVNDDYSKAEKIVRDTLIDKGLNSSIVKYNNNILYAYKNGVFKYNSENQQFLRDTTLSKLYSLNNYTSGKLISDNDNNTIWNFSKHNLSYISPSKLSRKAKVNKIPFSTELPRGLTGYENISTIQNNSYLIGTSTGYILLDLNRLGEKVYDISINSIIKSNVRDSVQIVDKSSEGVFKNEDNNVEITYSVVEFEKYLDTEYQYQLEGIYPEWSNWSSKSNVLFKNLPYGDYVFNVRAKIGNTLSKNTATYSFSIERPWYLSNTFIVLYIVLFLILSLITHNIYKRYYRKQRERLMQKSKRDLELKELENKQQLMRFNNDKLRQDIESKNRELGLSTMNLIKKNEFLNSIKKELKNISDSDNKIKSVIRIIDRNLNDKDDWNVFEEAFNNADKDFIKKIKTLHSSLTSNDLRLCAYLRLNLSSKEIAPLLNISSRSVEVKRYRLRKKIGLPHESSLTDYILEI